MHFPFFLNISPLLKFHLKFYLFFRLGEACNHIGALLHALVYVTEKKKDGLLASTSSKCAWNNPRKRKLSPKKASELLLKKVIPDNHTEDFEATVDENRFREKLLSFQSKAGWLTNFEKENGNQLNENECSSVNKISTGISFMYHDSKDLSTDDAVNEFTKYFSKLEMSNEECETIERKTRGQVGNNRWTLQRHGRITSSNFGYVNFRKETTQPDGLVKRLFQYTTFDNMYVRWGRTHEPAARRMYQNARKEACVEQCGLIINPAYPHLGASPDGLVFDPRSTDPYGTLEIKCPASWRNLSPSECAKHSNFFCQIDQDTGAITLKHNHVYYCQVQGQLAITGRQWCDFVVWTLRQPFSVERIYFDPEFWSNMLKKLNKFYIHGVLPELFTLRVKRGIPLYKN